MSNARSFWSLILAYCSFLSFVEAQTVVQNLSDTGPGSLREAITNAVDDEVITFDPGLSGGTILLTGDSLVARENITIDGSALAKAIKIDPAGTSRILIVRTDSAVTIRSLEFTNGVGRGGGAIFNVGTLTMENCTLHQNTSTGTAGTEDGKGGAIYSEGDISLTNCTIAHNVANLNGGAIHMESGIADLNHCTITRNSVSREASFAAISYFIGGLGGGPVTFTANTEQRYRLNNTIVCGNFGSGRKSPFPNQDIAPALLIELPGSTNLIGENALLSPLDNYGGAIPTIMPISSSPAIDVGSPNPETTDQRGASRQSGPAPDLGAVETGSLPNFDILAITNPVVTLANDRNEFAGNPVGLSLREAIVRATSESKVTFAPSLSGQKIELSRGRLELEKKLTLDGSSLADQVAISGSDQSRVFYIAKGSSASLRSLTICDGFVEAALINPDFPGREGGGILSDGSLSLFRCLIKENYAHSGGGLESRFDAICHINQCRFEDNQSAYNGGGARLWGQAAVENSLFLNNQTSPLGGGVGGGISLSSTNPIGPEVSNCTFMGNSASVGGGIAASGQTIVHCTIVENLANSGGGINGSLNSFRLKSSIVYGNTAPTNPDTNPLPDSQSVGNLIGTDPLLGPLQDNDGPTLTLMPLPSSPAIDPETGSGAAPHETDQRGYFRTIGARADIGAVETSSLPFPERLDSPIVTSHLDVFRRTSTPDLGELSLREAIAYSAPGATITFSPNLPGFSLRLLEGEIQIPHALTLDGSGPSSSIQLDALSQSRFFCVPIGRELTLREIHFKNGNMDKIGEGLFIDDDEVIEQELAGGAIFALGGLTIDQCLFLNCRSNYHGGAIANLDDLSVSNSTFLKCLTERRGGAIWSFSDTGRVSITDSRFEDNRCGDLEFPDSQTEGGAVSISLFESELIIERCFFLNNQAWAAGAVFTASLNTRINDSTFVKNQASNGFAISTGPISPGVLFASTFVAENTTFYANRGLTSSSKNSINLERANAEITHCTIADLWTNGELGISAPARTVLKNTIISNANLTSEPSFDPASSGNYIGSNPLLSPLGDYGGPWPTLIPLPGSPALNLGSTTDLTNDQRGLPRISGDRPDAGAVERQNSNEEQSPITDLIVTRSDDPYLWDGNPTNLSLRQAVSLAATGSRIAISATIDRDIIQLENGPLEIDRVLEIDASGLSTPVRLATFKESTFFEIFSGATLSLSNFSVSGNIFQFNPLMRIRGGLELNQCRLTSNTTNLPLLWVYGTIQATDCNFESNQSRSGAGVATLFPGASGSFQRCSFIGNTGRNGGAIFAVSAPDENSQLTILSSTFHGNTAIDGGAIFTALPTTINQCTISGNRATNEGGGISAQISPLTIANSVVALNESPNFPQIASPETITGPNFLSGNPEITPPGYFGGFTMTMPPLLGSPLIDAGINTIEPLDQRGQPRISGAVIDIGAVEFQGEETEFLFTFELDSDRDGVSNGLEIATGRNPFVAGDSPDLDLKILPDGMISTGFDPASADSIIFKVTRSQDLLNFETILLSNETTPLVPEGGLLLFEDPAPLPKSFYRIEVSPR